MKLAEELLSSCGGLKKGVSTWPWLRNEQNGNTLMSRPLPNHEIILYAGYVRREQRMFMAFRIRRSSDQVRGPFKSGCMRI